MFLPNRFTSLWAAAALTTLLGCITAPAWSAPAQAARGTVREAAVNNPDGQSAGSARAGAPVTVTARLTFYDAFEDRQRAIVGVPVEVWTFAPRGIIWTWAKMATGTTGSAGRFVTRVPFQNGNVLYALRVVTRNSSAICCSGFPSGWVVEPLVGGKPVYRKATGPGDTVRFNHTFTGTVASVFNTLDVVRHAGAFARRFETDIDSDRIGVARIGFAGSGPKDASWFDPVAYTMNLTPRARWRDDVILHEYAHYLQAQIGSFAWIASSHSGCTPGPMWVFGGQPVDPLLRQRHAWLEGFADWFAEVAYWDHPSFYAETQGNRGQYLESASCPEAGAWPDGDRFEYHVAAFLWDMTDPSSSSEPNDLDGGPVQTAAIFRALDKELDTAAWPTVADLAALYVTNWAEYPSTSSMDNAFANRVSYIVIN